MIIFFLNAPLHPSPSTSEHRRQLIHYRRVPFSPSACHTRRLPSCRPLPPLSPAEVSWCENLIMVCHRSCKLNWTKSRKTGPEPVLRDAQTDPHVCGQRWINHEGGSISVTVPRCWDFPPFQAGGNGGNGAIWPRWQKEARSQLHISQVFNWHLIHSALLPATS